MSDDSEKKISLDELPDEGSSSFLATPAKTPPRKKKAPADPRITKLRSLETDASKVALMEQYWHFDKKDWLWGWVIYIILLLTVERLDYYQQLMADVAKLDEVTMGFGSAFTDTLIFFFEATIKHPSVFIILTPIFFKFKTKSENFFDITFDGISTVKKVITKDSKELTMRVFIKWHDIAKVEKTKAAERDILRLYSPEGRIGEIIWDIEESKKHAVKQLLSGLVSPKHPLREFFSKGNA